MDLNIILRMNMNSERWFGSAFGKNLLQVDKFLV